VPLDRKTDLETTEVWPGVTGEYHHPQALVHWEEAAHLVFFPRCVSVPAMLTRLYCFCADQTSF
jgi:hypothetical protein